ncbi:MAG: SDR family NAD(P)-dependent oxidoreductase, partial [Oceanobacillus sp.]|nr:SDR family NAD(P)-dependent oxidoreductase [Oceanobacillus sp.]
MVENKVVFITGAASGIGYEIGKEFAKNGAKVALSDINAEKVQEVSENLRKDGYDCIGLKCDVTNEKELQQALDETVEKYGRLDVL